LSVEELTIGTDCFLSSSLTELVLDDKLIWLPLDCFEGISDILSEFDISASINGNTSFNDLSVNLKSILIITSSLIPALFNVVFFKSSIVPYY